MANKEWWKSKTVLAAVFSAVVVIITAWKGDTSPLVAGLVAVGSALGIYGRFVSNTGLK